jgi:hypothetical protein
MAKVDRPETIHRIQEQFSAPGVRRALAGSYRNPLEAVAELVDNSWDARIEGSPLAVSLTANRNRLVVSDIGGDGMDLEGLTKLMHWGESGKKDDGISIGQFGVGGKAAMAFLGKSVHISSSPAGSSRRFDLKIGDWSANQSSFEVVESATEIEQGYVVISIENLRYNPRLMTPEMITRRLGSTYREPLLGGELSITVGSDRKSMSKVSPLEIPYVTTPGLTPEKLNVQTSTGEVIRVEIGVVDSADMAADPRLTPGFRTDYRGRLIADGMFFGMDPKNYPGLVGQVSLREATVLTNKTGFATGDPRYISAAEAVQRTIEPWAKKLEGRRPVEDPKVAKERASAESAKRDVEGILSSSDILMDDELIGVSSGRRPAAKDGAEKKEVPTGRTRKDSEGKTPPAHDATDGIDLVKRKGLLARWDIESFGNSQTEAEIVFGNMGIGEKQVGKNGPYLRFNADHPSYLRVRDSVDPLALREHLAHVGAFVYLRYLVEARHESNFNLFHDKYNALRTKISEYYLELSSRRVK